MNIILLGAAGFIGTNLVIELAKDLKNTITLVDKSMHFFLKIKSMNFPNVLFKESNFDESFDFYNLLNGKDIVYHLVSNTIPSNSNRLIDKEIFPDITFTSKLLESCVNFEIKKLIFISSGGTVYGNQNNCPLSEEMETNPINSYGVQKVTIEKLIYLYNYIHGLKYKIIRLSNPYGPYQRPNGVLGAVTTFTYKALQKQEIVVYGDGDIVRDFIYIDDVIKGIIKIANDDGKYNLFNLGIGYGTSIKDVLNIIKKTLSIDLNITYQPARKVDVPINYLNISRYEEIFGPLNPISLQEGIKRTADFFNTNY